MVGGTVINVVRTMLWSWVQCLDETYSQDTCAVRVVEHSPLMVVNIKPGDHLWWQGDKAMWTPQDGHWMDVQLNKIGNSHREIPQEILDAVWSAK